MIGPQRSAFRQYVECFGTDPTVDQAGWEAAGSEAGLHPVNVDYATVADVSPGAQLFALASTLFDLGFHAALGQPNGNAVIWKERIVS